MFPYHILSELTWGLELKFPFFVKTLLTKVPSGYNFEEKVSLIQLLGRPRLPNPTQLKRGLYLVNLEVTSQRKYLYIFEH